MTRIACAVMALFIPTLAPARATSAAPTSIGFSAQSSTADSPYDPRWALVAPLVQRRILYDTQATPESNGRRFILAANALTPGIELIVDSGTWVLPVGSRIVAHGVYGAPISIRASLDGQTFLVSPSNSNASALGIGGGAGSAPIQTASYLTLRGFDISGGTSGVDIGRASRVWIDRCHIHRVGGQGILAAAFDTDRLYVTRCEINDTGGWGEGIALGNPSTGEFTHHSVIALNYIHDTRHSTEGDGIDLRWHCYANWIAENVIHRTKFPAILFHGTAGNTPNLIERNICWDTLDNVMQAEGGEAIVRNNLLMGPCVNKVFDSSHEASTLRDLVVVHNTMFAPAGYCVGLFAWNGQPNLVFANNAVYSRTFGPNGYAISYGVGQIGGILTGNVVVGSTLNLISGFTLGAGLSDFANVTSWDHVFDDAADFRPAAASALSGSANPAFPVVYDLLDNVRVAPFDVGALEGP